MLPQAELVCGVSDAVKLAAQRTASDLRLLAAAAAVVLGAALLALVSADMHFTARLFHERGETLAALLAGLALFQVRTSLCGRVVGGQASFSHTECLQGIAHATRSRQQRTPSEPPSCQLDPLTVPATRPCEGTKRRSGGSRVV